MQVETLIADLQTNKMMKAQTEEILICAEAELEYENKTRSVPNKKHEADIANHRTNLLRQADIILRMEKELAEKRAQAAS